MRYPKSAPLGGEGWGAAAWGGIGLAGNVFMIYIRLRGTVFSPLYNGPLEGGRGGPAGALYNII